MKAETVRTIWFSRNSLLAVALDIPVWGIAGLGWGLFMLLWMGGDLVRWLSAGVYWGIGMWVEILSNVVDGHELGGDLFFSVNEFDARDHLRQQLRAV
jgi:hypothetical protein